VVTVVVQFASHAAGISDHFWSIEKPCALLPQAESAARQIDKELILKALG
jgi:hypothetical protein